MWDRLVRLSTPLSTLIALLQEQNSLLRELLRAQGVSPQTPRTPYSLPPPPPVRRAARLTARDVQQVTRETWIEQELRAREKIDAPWRSAGENVPVLYPPVTPDR